jgi:hypothetical protein
VVVRRFDGPKMDLGLSFSRDGAELVPVLHAADRRDLVDKVKRSVLLVTGDALDGEHRDALGDRQPLVLLGARHAGVDQVLGIGRPERFPSPLRQAGDIQVGQVRRGLDDPDEELGDSLAGRCSPSVRRMRARMTTSSPTGTPSHSATSSAAGPRVTVVVVAGWRPTRSSIVQNPRPSEISVDSRRRVV